MTELRWHEVESSNVLAVAYRRTNHTLWIQFTSGRVYRYDGVPLQIMGALMRSRSKGRMVNKIRARWQGELVEPKESR